MKAYYIPTKENTELLNSILQLVESKFKNDIIEVINTNYNCTIIIKKQALLPMLTFLRDNQETNFAQLMDVTAVDNAQPHNRFSVIYNLLSIYHNLRLQLLVNVNEHEDIPSAHTVFTSATWLEREIWDLFGIYFVNHPNLTRLLNDFGFNGHPLRKDFPITGYSEVFYNPNTQKVEYKQLELSQAYRSFNYQNPWLENIEAETFAYLNKNNKDGNE